jgi:uncharacterized coiled-coil DUF342 family protein
MSKYNYNPEPARVWSRVQSEQTYINENFPFQYDVYVPLIDETIPQEDADFLAKQINKGNILQYKANSAMLTKSQKYSQLARGMGPSRKKVFATQSETYTNPNTTGLLRKDYITYNQNDIIGAPKNPDNCPDNLIKDGGTLVAGIYENPCTGEIYKEDEMNANLFFPSSASDVPGQDQLYWNAKLQPWTPRQRYKMTNSSNKWPINYKGLKSALTPNIIPPIIRFTLIQNNSININWKMDYLYKMDSFNIYVNGVYIKNIPNNESYSYSLSIQETDDIINSSTDLPEEEQTKNLVEPNLLKLLVLKSSDLDTLKSFVSKATNFNIPTNLYYINFTSVLNKTESPFSNTLQIDTTPYKVADISNNIPDPSNNHINNPCCNPCCNPCYNHCNNSSGGGGGGGGGDNTNTDNKLNQIINLISNLTNSVDNIENDVTVIRDNNNSDLLNIIYQKVDDNNNLLNNINQNGQEIEDISDKITSLDFSVKNISNNLDGLKYEIDKIDDKIDVNNNIISQTNTNVNKLLDDIDNIDDKIDILEFSVTHINNNIEEISDDISEIKVTNAINNNLINDVKDFMFEVNDNVLELNSKLDINNNLINNTRSDFEEFSGETTNQLLDINDKLDAINFAIFDITDLGDSVNEINLKLDTNNNLISDVSDFILEVNDNVLELTSQMDDINVKIDTNNTLITNVNDNVNLLRDEINEKLNNINSLSIDILSKTTSILDKVTKCGCGDGSSNNPNPSGCDCTLYNSLFTNNTIATINSYVLQYISTAFDESPPDIVITLEQFNFLNMRLNTLDLLFSENPECCFRNVIEIYRNILKIIKYGFDDRQAKKSALLAAETWKQDSIILRDKEKLQEYLENLNNNFSAMSFQITSKKINIKIQYQVYHERYGIPYNLEYDPTLLKAIMEEYGIVY